MNTRNGWRSAVGVLGLVGGLAWGGVTGSALAASGTNWVEHFSERFETPAGDRFRVFPMPIPGRTSAGGSLDHDAAGKAAWLSGWLQVVRPVQAGAQVRLEVDLKFEPDPGLPAGMEKEGVPAGPPETGFSLVLFNRAVVRAVIVRPGVEGGRGRGRVRLDRVAPGMTQAVVVSDVELAGAPPDGRWTLEYRHGLMVVRQGTNRVAVADFGMLGVQVAGVGWEQRGGKVRCSGMTLSGLPVRTFGAEERATLEEAGRLNEEAQRLAREGGKGEKAPEAVAKMREALALFVKVHGEEHHDAANACANLAAMLDLLPGKETRAESRRLWEKALAVHERVLGAGHPHTTLTRFNLGRHLLDAGEQDLARAAWVRCRADWLEVMGPDYPSVRSLDEILSGL